MPARLFVAAWPPAEIVEAVAALPRPAVTGLRWTRPEQWHVTLRFLGRVDDTAAEEVNAALADASARTGPAAAVVGPAVGRFGHRILHVPVDGLAGVAAAVVGATAHLGKPPEDRPFAGHLTLARVADRARLDLRPLAGAQIGGDWPVDEVTLVESTVSRAGSTYEVVARFPLTG